MAINLNPSSQPSAPTSPSGDRAGTQQTRSDSTDTSARSTLFVNLSDQSQSLSNSLNNNESRALDLIDNKSGATPTTADMTERRINTLEQQQASSVGEQQELRDESERIEQQIRALEQQERTIDQRLNRLRQGQTLGQFVDLKA